MELTRSELEIMDVFWDSECPLSCAELLEKATVKRWKDSSVHILLNGLLQKQALHEAGFVKCNKTYGRTFSPALTREQYYAAAVFSRRRKPEVVGLIGAILAREELTPEQLESIRAIMAEK